MKKSEQVDAEKEASQRRAAADRRRRHLLAHELQSKSLALTNEAVGAIEKLCDVLAPAGARLPQGRAVSEAIMMAADDLRRKAWKAFESEAAKRELSLRDYLRLLWNLNKQGDREW